MKSGPILFVLKGYPRLSETFIAQEIKALEERGLDIRIMSLRHPTDSDIHPIHRAIQAPVTYLPEYLHNEPARVFRAWLKVRTLPGYKKAWSTWRQDFRRDRTRNRMRRFGQAMVLAAECPTCTKQIHAHFLHTPASVARYSAMMLELPWSASAHAKDIWTSPNWELSEKLDSAKWTVTCTRSGAEHLATLATEPNSVALVYHGLDLQRFPTTNPVIRQRDGKTVDDPVVVLSVGRAVAKKGYDGLLTALSSLPIDMHWRLIHIGGGSDLANLKALSNSLGLSERIEWRGPQSQEGVFAAYQQADIFVLNSQVAKDGDRDGLPNVLMEAQAMGLPCIATHVSAIPELIEDGVSGILVPTETPPALAAALSVLINNPDKRLALAKSGLKRVQQSFSMTTGIDDLQARFEQCPTQSHEPVVGA